MGEKSARQQTGDVEAGTGDNDSQTDAYTDQQDSTLSPAVDRDYDSGQPAARPDRRVQPSVQRDCGCGREHDAAVRDGYVSYDTGPDRASLSNRYDMTVQRGAARRLQRLEAEHGHEQVRRWADEGMTVDTMGKPRDMAAFRRRQAERSGEIPADIERRNQASVRRNAARNRDDGPAGDTGVPDVVRSVVSSSGTSMDESVQREMESKMGGDFSDVQVHTGSEAAAAAESINARAFTVGNHVAFNRGEYQPDSDQGKRVLAHELTHVRQQTEGRVSLLPQADAEHPGNGAGPGVHVQPKLEVSSPDDPAEKEARAVAEQVMGMDDERGQRGHEEPPDDRTGPSRGTTPGQSRASTVQRAGGWTSWLGLADDKKPPGEVPEGKRKIVKQLGFDWEENGYIPRPMLRQAERVIDIYGKIAKNRKIHTYLRVKFLSTEATIVEGKHGPRLEIPTEFYSSKELSGVLASKGFGSSLTNAFGAQGWVSKPIQNGNPATFATMFASAYSIHWMRKTHESLRKPRSKRDEEDRERIEEWRGEGKKHSVMKIIASGTSARTHGQIEREYGAGKLAYDNLNGELQAIIASNPGAKVGNQKQYENRE